MTVDELIKRLDKRLDEAKREIASLQRARAALDSTPTPRHRRRRKHHAVRAVPNKIGRRRRRARLDGPKLEAILGEGGASGLSTTELVDKSGSSRARVLHLLRELERSGNVRRTGERNSTRWHPVTDEDRIAARAAELQSRSKRKQPSTRQRRS